jgi:DNA-binding CsgD family transcriptional regulator
MDDQKGTDGSRTDAADAARSSSPKRRRGFHRKTTGKPRAPVVRRSIDLSKVVAMVSALPLDPGDADVRRRRMLAEVCKVVGAHLAGQPGVAAGVALAPRMRQTLDRLVEGDSERQIALKLKISQHTVHVYVKKLYKRFGVSSRGELLARFVRGNGT